MEIKINESARLTTEHSASSYGLPVLVLEGQAYGAGDVLPSGDSAAAYVERWMLLPERTAEEMDGGKRFLGPWGTLVAPGDIAARTGYPADTIRRWANRHPEFRALAAETSAGLIWRWGDAEAWLRRTGRLKDS